MSANVQVKAVANRKDTRRFIALPYELYRECPYWVAPLRLEQELTLSARHNPFCRHGKIQPFLAVDGSGSVLGRIAAIVNGMHLEHYRDGTGFFGFFECVPRHEVAQALLDAAADWLRAQGLVSVRGPCSPSMNDVSGLLVKGFEREPSIYMPYNPPFYEEYLQRCGFERAMTTYAYYIHKRYADFERVRPWLDEIQQHYPGLALKHGDRRRFAEQAALVFEIYNEGWSGNWGHVPMTKAEFAQLSWLFRYILDPQMVFFAELDGRTIGFVLALPNLNEVLRHVRSGRLWPLGWLELLLRWKAGGVRGVRAAMAGMRPEYRGHGLAAVMGLLAVQHSWIGRYEAVELSWILQTNKLLVDAMERIGAVRDKEYAFFEKRL